MDVFHSNKIPHRCHSPFRTETLTTYLPHINNVYSNHVKYTYIIF